MSNGSTPGRAAVSVLVYAAARLALAAVLAVLIYWLGRALGVQQLPIAVAALFALVIAMPLGFWLFGPLRRRATAGIDAATERRRRDRDQLRARLRGEALPEDGAEASD